MKKQNGFTLLELMIVVVIIGILSSIAAPSYISYLEKGKLEDAQKELMDLAFRQEEFYRDKYTNTLADLNHTGNTENGLFKISISSTDLASGYLITATIVAGKEKEIDAGCHIITLSSTGAKEPDGNPGTEKDCW